MLEIALVIGGLITTVALGGPIASALARPHTFRRPAPRETGGDRERHTPQAGFKPLDLGPDPVSWPSAREWRTSGIDQPTWPSKTWDDEHFGSHWRDGRMVEINDLGFHAMAGRRFDSSVDQGEAVRRNEEASRERYRAAKAQQREALKARRSSPKGSGVRRPTPAPVAPTPSAPTPKAKPRAPSAPNPPARQPPDRAEIEGLIAQVGLAGTVQAIMERTGWDFRKAAHYPRAGPSVVTALTYRERGLTPFPALGPKDFPVCAAVGGGAGRARRG